VGAVLCSGLRPALVQNTSVPFMHKTTAFVNASLMYSIVLVA